MNKQDFRGIFPAFYACYDEQGAINTQAITEFTNYLISKNIQGLYVGGSSGECIYQSVAERKLVLETVMKANQGRIKIIAHVACNNTADSCELAAHAESLKVDAIAAIPPIYFHLSDKAIAKYWNAISDAAPNTAMILYNIPVLAGVELNVNLLNKMLENPRVIGVKNSSMSILDIQDFTSTGAIVFNGPDEQLLSGLAAGAIGGIGGTYGAMPELFLALYEAFQANDITLARQIQLEIYRIIQALCSTEGSMYATIKAVIKMQTGLELGSVRAPFLPNCEDDLPKIQRAYDAIATAINKYCH